MRALLIGIAGLLALPGTASALPPFTTAAKTSTGTTPQSELHSPAVGCHPTYDRFVIRARRSTPNYDVRYVNQIIQDGSGNRCPCSGATAFGSGSATPAATPPTAPPT